jgi:two-component system sensor histidine kinase/response regulator
MIPSDFTSTLLNAHEKRATILIVDDEVVNRILLTRILKVQHALVEADSAKLALAILEQQPVDLVLLDIMMPEMNGLEALDVIRKQPETSQTPVILISALSRTADIVAGLHLGANDYITKPIDVEVVLARVETQLKLKRMMDLQKRVIAEFEASQQLKDRLLRIASHDLRSPLMNIHMVETLLRDSLADDPEAAGLLDMLQHTVFYMNGIIEEFLDVAACQSGRIELQLRDVNAHEIVVRVINEFGVMAARKDIEFALGALSGTVYADPSRVIQILNNLVSNAVKYSPHGTTVTLWTEAGDEFVRFFVADQGPGIPDNERDRLFTEFGKLSPRPTGDESSTGLGLWIVKHMVMLHGGVVGVDCPDRGGSIFWFDLPLYRGQ